MRQDTRLGEPEAVERVQVFQDGAAQELNYTRYSDGEWSQTSTLVPAELPLTIYVNGEELVTISCTPDKLNCLVLGFLYSEDVISSVDDVASMRVCLEDSLAEVWLSKAEYSPPLRRTLTSGCGGGVSFSTKLERVNSELVVLPQEVLSAMRKMQEGAKLFQLCGGVHTSALSDRKSLLVLAEDIGRHNTLDKIQGECLLKQIPTRDCILLTTGRVSSEVLLKVARMAIPIVASRSAPTSRAVSLAEEAGITLIGYTRGRRLSLYSHPSRVSNQL